MNSEQEKIVRLLAERSMGAPFIFEPDEYRKGNATREPPDLAWVASRCAVLFWMQRLGTKGSIEAIEHNLRQAKGWMRAWRGGQPLNGANADRKFSIPYADVAHVAVVSVVDAVDVPLVYHHKEAGDLGVRRCATISQTALHMLADMGASMVDLLVILDIVRKQGEVPPYQVIEQIAAIEQTAWSHAAMSVPRMADVKGALAEALQIVRTLRVPTPKQLQFSPQLKNPFACAECFNDLMLIEHLRLVALCARMMGQVRQRAVQVNGTLSLAAALELDRHDIVVRAATDFAVMTKSLKVGSAPAMNRPNVPGKISGKLDLLLCGMPFDRSIFHVMPFMASVAFHGRTGPSRVQEILELA